MAETAAFILTREWHDARPGATQAARGGDVVLWCSSPQGPVRVRITGVQPVCFIERTVQLPADASARVARRKPLDLLTPSGAAVDGLYFRSLRDQQELRRAARDSGVRIFESDIRPAERYLMERFIHAGITVEGFASTASGVRTFENPVLRAAELEPTLTTAALDIETNGFDGPVLSIGVHMPLARHQPEAVFVVTPPSGAARDHEACITWFECERDVLQALVAWLHENDPDLIIGWNVIGFDLSVLERRFAEHRLPFTLGRTKRAARILPASGASSLPVAIVPGRVVLDGIECLRAAFFNFEDFRLEAVAQELLGRGKLIEQDHSENRLDEILRLYREDPLALARYNLEDCRLVTDIFAHTKLVQMSISRAQLTGLAFGRLGGSAASLDNLYLPRLHRRGRVALDVGDSNADAVSPGGYVLDSVPGLYDNVLLLDFKSLYPSLIRTFQVDPLGLWAPGVDPIEGFLGARFAREGAILPALIAQLWSARDAAKAARIGPLSHAIKIIMNAFYGVLGSSGCRFFDPRLTSSITRRGHEVLKRSRDYLEAKGLKVIYGDTDSLFVWLGAHDAAHPERTGRKLADELNNWWRQTLLGEHNVESFLEVEFETHFQRFLMPTLRGSELGSKKRYAGLVNVDGKAELVFKGLESVRTDWTPLARNFQRELYRRIFTNENYDDFVKRTCEQLLAGALDDQLVYRKRLRRDVSDYHTNVPPQVQAARLAGQSSGWVRYVITRHGPQPVGTLDATPDYEHYKERQLAPVADAILHFKETTFAALTDRQMEFF
jgi:DNA polymerase II